MEIQIEEAMHNEEAAQYAEKLGFTRNQNVECATKLSFIEKYWHKLSEKAVVGKITKFAIKKDRLGRTRIKVELNGKPELFHLENCEPEFEHTLTKLDEIKKSKYIKKQLEKLKTIIHQIETLNPTGRDYELRLKLLNEEYTNTKLETDKLLHGSEDLSSPASSTASPTASSPILSSSSDSETVTDNKVSILKKLDESRKLEEEEKMLLKATQKKDELMNALKLNAPKVAERLNPLDTKVPAGLKTVGGHRMLQHAGSINLDAGSINLDAGSNNYLELKKTINNVSLDSILLEANSLLQKLN